MAKKKNTKIIITGWGNLTWNDLKVITRAIKVWKKDLKSGKEFRTSTRDGMCEKNYCDVCIISKIKIESKVDHTNDICSMIIHGLMTVNEFDELIKFEIEKRVHGAVVKV